MRDYPWRRLALPRSPGTAEPSPALPTMRVEGVRKEAIEVGRQRVVLGGLFFAMAFVVLAVRLCDVALLAEPGRGALRSALAGPGAAADAMPATRADVIDRNGETLATDLATTSVYADPKEVLDPAVTARRLATVLDGIDAEALAQRLSGGGRFTWIKRQIPPHLVAAVNGLGLPGVHFRTEYRRVYPHGELFAHVVGFTGRDNEGLAGVEKQFDDELRPGRAKAPLALSLDLRVQYAVYDELAAAMKEFQAKAATGIVIDAQSGEVLSMVSLPSFDPNRPEDRTSDAQFNRATLGLYEMGSTFKIFTVAGALDAGKVTMRGGYDASEPIKISRFTIRDYHAQNRWLSVPEIFMHSSNIGAAKMAADLGSEQQRAFLQRLGLLSAATVELPEVAAPMIPSPWREINTMTIGFGHGIAVSATQVAAATAAVINGGMLHPATIVRRAPGLAVPGTRVVSERTSEQMRRLFRLVVTEGTARQASVDGYLVGGKTGTAEKSSGGGYKRKALLSSLVAAFPMTAPRYVAMVMLDEPQATARTHGYATGGWTAAPAVGRIVARIGPMLGLMPVDEDTDAVRRAMVIDSMQKERRVASF